MIDDCFTCLPHLLALTDDTAVAVIIPRGTKLPIERIQFFADHRHYSSIKSYHNATMRSSPEGVAGGVGLDATGQEGG